MSFGQKYWFGEDPVRCELCREPIYTAFVDGATRLGPWAAMCPVCWAKGLGIGGEFGEGRGQKYVKQSDGRWLKVDG